MNLMTLFRFLSLRRIKSWREEVVSGMYINYYHFPPVTKI